MSSVLGSETATHETAPGGFFISPELESVEGVVPRPDEQLMAGIDARRPSPEAIAAAQATVTDMLAEEGAQARIIRGRNDVCAPKDSGRRDSDDARWYIAYERALGVANCAFDHVPTPGAIRTVITGATPPEGTAG